MFTDSSLDVGRESCIKRGINTAHYVDIKHTPAVYRSYACTPSATIDRMLSYLKHPFFWGPTACSVALLVLLGATCWEYQEATADHQQTVTAFASSTDTYRSFTYEIRIREARLAEEKEAVIRNLTSEQERNNAIQNQIDGLKGSVAVIQKVNATDKELLQKYSKVYFLNENYAPPQLTVISPEFVWGIDKALETHAQVTPFLHALLGAARSQNIDLAVLSAYRSFNTQASLKSAYTVRYGAGANAFSADQGYSEHQLGTTVDFTTRAGGSVLAGFDETAAFTWLREHAHLYGFVLSYPEGNNYYVYEPWHWRFVGVELASKLHAESRDFYDMDQRVLDTYRISLFD
ncbi:MAG: putative carboxypeptidase YodJ [Nitrosomonadaceae bacterium]|nr:putative carboxypeptidase YodJ [Nitrosomonadaceae bacterium]